MLGLVLALDVAPDVGASTSDMKPLKPQEVDRGRHREPNRISTQRRRAVAFSSSALNSVRA